MEAVNRFHIPIVNQLHDHPTKDQPTNQPTEQTTFNKYASFQEGKRQTIAEAFPNGSLSFSHLLVADTRLYLSLFGPSVRPSVHRKVLCWGFLFLPTHPRLMLPCILACTEMTINNKIRTPQVVLIVGLSWASKDITFGLKKLHLAVRALSWIFLQPMGNQKFQNA